MRFRVIPLLLSALAITACVPKSESTRENTVYSTVGTIERLSPKLDDLIKPGAQIEILAEGFDWAEGPLWLPEQDMVVFSDVPQNRIYSWREGDHNAAVYLQPSGYTGTTGQREGSNGLILDSQGRLVICQHGDRRMARMNASLDHPKPDFTTLADSYHGKRLNSPNDAVYDREGNLYFTDPPYGLAGHEAEQELSFQGVYRLSTDGKLTLLTDELSRPNGIAFSPDEKTLYVANSDPEHAVWMAYDVKPDGTIGNGRIFHDATEFVKQAPGLPDGMKVDDDGNLYASGPGGVWIFSADGEHLGTIHTGQATANCAFNKDKSVLYLTADMYLMRVVLK